MIKGVGETIHNEAEKQNNEVLSRLSDILAASSFGNMAVVKAKKTRQGIKTAGE